MTSEDPSLRYPIGSFKRAESFTPKERSTAIEGLRQLPQNLRSAVNPLSAEQLEIPYRPGGWTVRQLVHHVADSHMNAYSRVRLALTEEWPTIFAYRENLWANLEDARTTAVTTSLDLLDALHRRWVELFSSLEEKDWKRGYTHPENGRQSVEQALILYDWHGRHHTAHVTRLLARLGR
ncbi:MAG: putative metal-dependent hydrolase [Acidobacteriaceae bacterium]